MLALPKGRHEFFAVVRKAVDIKMNSTCWWQFWGNILFQSLDGLTLFNYKIVTFFSKSKNEIFVSYFCKKKVQLHTIACGFLGLRTHNICHCSHFLFLWTLLFACSVDFSAEQRVGKHFMLCAVKILKWCPFNLFSGVDAESSDTFLKIQRPIGSLIRTNQLFVFSISCHRSGKLNVRYWF